MGSKFFLAQCRSAVSARITAGLSCILVLNALATATAPVPNGKPDNYPNWWFEREVVPQATQTPSTQPAWPGDYRSPDDYGMANLGQLKHIATEAAAELNEHLPGGAGTEVNNMVAKWASVPDPGVVRDDFAAVNLGQLKAVAKLFYDKLIAVRYISHYPWGDGSADDFAVANLGQVKYIFSFDLTYDSNDDNIPDWWAMAAGLNPSDETIGSSTVANPGLDINGHQPTYLEAYQNGIDPVTAATPTPNQPPVLQANPTIDLSTVTYAAIDVSSNKTTQDVVTTAIDDNNQVGFMWYSLSENGVATASFQNGQIGDEHVFPYQGPISSFSWVANLDEEGTHITYGAQFWSYRFYSSCDASGRVAGSSQYGANDWQAGEPPGFSRIFYASDASSFTEFWPPRGEDAPYIGSLGFPALFSNQISFASVSANLGFGGLMAGVINSYDWHLGYSVNYGFIASGASGTYFRPDQDTGYWPTVFSPKGASAGAYSSNQNNPSLQPQFAVCTGVAVTPIGSLDPIAVSDNGLVIGDDLGIRDDMNSISVNVGQGTRLLSSYLPPQYTSGIRFPRSPSGDTSRLTIPIGEMWINDHGDIIINAQLAKGDLAHKEWIWRTLLWKNAFRLDTGKPSTLSFVTLPDRVFKRSQFNNNCNFAGVIYVTENDHMAAGLLLPFQFKEVNPESGFDAETKPNWLMVPQNQQNWTEAITSASSSLEVKFKFAPNVQGASVAPNSTNHSAEILTVGSPELGDGSSIVIGVGDSFADEGLKLSVKKYQMKTVVIHAVTQRYALDHYMPLQANEGIANVVCVKPKPNAAIVGGTSPGGDDQAHPDGSIDVGANGICETNADVRYDEQVIPVGWGVHKDIPAQNVPSALALQNRLNEVFGIQSNTYFTVTRVDKIVDYDILKNQNGSYDKVLNMTGTSDLGDEEKILRDQVKAPANFNVYYVHDFHFGNAVGKALFNSGVAYVKDFDSDISNVMDVTAHEIGHCFGLPHCEKPKLYDAFFAPANPTYLPDSDPTKRLMYGGWAGFGVGHRLLIKAEWDIINPNP